VVVLDRMYDYHRRVIAGLREALETRDVPLVVHVNGLYHERAPAALLRQLAAGAYRGVITMALNDPRIQAELFAAVSARRHLVPAVGVGPRLPGCPHVDADNRSGMAELMDHLLDEQGARRVALVTGVPHHPDTLEREGVVRQSLARRGLPLDPDLVVEGYFDRDPAYRATAALLQRRPGLRDVDAVVALNDLSAFGALDALYEQGLRVPRDLLVTGFDDHETSGHPEVGLTTVSQSLHEQGAAAGELLLGLLAGEDHCREVRVPTRLVVRSSSRRERPELASGGRSRTGDSYGGVATSALSAGLGGASGIDDTVLAMHRAFTTCRTVEDVMTELTASLPRLGVTRCFVVLRDGATDGAAVGRLVLDFPGRDGRAAQGLRFASAALLPEPLLGELGRGALVLQSLAVSDEELGYVLFEQAEFDGMTAEVLRLDLSRTLDGIARNRKLAEHAEELERLVTERTRQLEHEVAVRRRAEEDLTAVNAELRASLHLDGLTGIANRVAFDDRAADLWASHARSGERLSLLVVDVDFFKDYNDHYGHLLGDEALRQVARCLRRAAVGPDDLCARYGGEEFALLLPRTHAAGALVVGERIRALLAERALPHAASTVSRLLTVSTGVATTVPTTDSGLVHLVGAADRALYAAKRAGRDRVVAAPAETTADAPADVAGVVPRGRTASGELQDRRASGRRAAVRAPRGGG
jgi:diguanylate cyclase (GGDEF)-like protein